MRNTLICLTLALVAMPFAESREHPVAPDWTLPSADGRSVRLGDAVDDRATILFFWATWCPYCKALMPHLQSIRLEMGDRVQVLAINFRDDGDPAAYVRDAGYDFTVLPDGDAVAEQYGIWGTPGVLVVDRNRRTRFDLRNLPRPKLPDAKAGHGRKAAYLAPYWAAAIRKSLDEVVADYERAETAE